MEISCINFVLLTYKILTRYFLNMYSIIGTLLSTIADTWIMVYKR